MKRWWKRLLAASGLAGLLAALCKRKGRCCRSGTVRWLNSPDWATDGSLANIASFNTHLANARPCYRHYPESAAQAILGMDPAGGSPQAPFTLAYGPSAGSGETDVTITFESLEDDSVAATRYRFTFVDEGFVGGTAGEHRLLHGLREFRCQPGRGHTDWGTDLCV